MMSERNMIVVHNPSATSCPDCRDVLEGDINSARTDWACFCGGACVASHGDLCARRQAKRTIARLVSLQCELALVLRQRLFIDAVDDFIDVTSIDGLPGRVIYYHRYEFADREAVLRLPFMPGLPEDVKLEACSVMNYLKIKFRELDIVPKPSKNFLFWRMDADVPDSSSMLHTVMVISPDLPEDTQEDTNWAVGPQLGDIYHEGGHISDPTYRQYAYESNGDKTSEYLWNKAKDDPDNQVLLFGDSYRVHRTAVEHTRNARAMIRGHIREAGIRTMNTAVHREIERLGGRRKFVLSSSHAEFLQGLRKLLDRVRIDLVQLRAEVDGIIFPPRSPRNTKRALTKLIDGHSQQEDDEVMAAFRKMELHAASLATVDVQLAIDADREEAEWHKLFKLWSAMLLEIRARRI